jgi:protein-S-isoprenylcysteine O-methyltransferase Ste14
MSGMSSEISARRLMIQSTIWLGIMFVLLFGGAGTFAWTEAWIYLLIHVSSSAVTGLWLKRHNPELLKVRMEFWKRMAKPWDKAVIITSMFVLVPFFTLPGLDAVRYRWSHVPSSVNIIGFVGILISSCLFFWVMKTNPYSSAAVEVQKEQGHKTITTGPYQIVRHPMYVGTILWFVSIPLALGSLLTFIPGVILTALIVVRTYLEDKTLHQELEGYAAYAQTVKYRLIPGTW